MVKENAQSFIDGVIRKRPSDQKGDYVKSITLSSTMSPGVKINKELN
jgi:large subunit ribosomal protein L1